MIRTIAARELRSLFLSPLAWSVLAVVQFIMAWLFLTQLDRFMQAQSRLLEMKGAHGVTYYVAAQMYGSASIILLMVVPLLTMRLVSEERRSGTLSLLLSAPVSMTEIVLGKFCGLFGFLLIMLGMITLMPLSLYAGTHLDIGQLASGFLGLALLLGAFAAAGLFISSLTRQPVVAAISTFGLLLLLWIINWAAGSGEKASAIFAYASLLQHYSALIKGEFDSSDVIYYLLFIAGFLGLSIRRLDAYRLQH